MEKTGIIELKRGKARKYEVFFLKRNPFPALGVPTNGVLITVDREAEIKRFQNIVSELLDNGTGIITVLVGAYGSGKSHLLKVFKNSVNAQLLSRDNGALAMYVKSPGEDFRDFFLGLVEDFGRPLLTQYSEEVIRDHVEKNKAEAETYIYRDEALSSFRDGNYEIGTLLQSSQYLDLFRDIKAARFRDIRSNDLVYGFLMLSHPDHSSKAWRWFLGERLEKEEKHTVSIETSIEDDETAYSVFRDLVLLLRMIGIASLVILVDELEKVTLIHAAKRVSYQDFLRRMIDDHPMNLCFYFAIAPHQWEALTKEPTALVRRLAGNWYVLEDFKREYTKELIEQYLYSVRVDWFSSKETKSKFGDCEPSLCPFTTKSVDAIQEVSGGRVSDVILICRKLLEYLYDNQEKYRSITPDLVEYVREQERLG